MITNLSYLKASFITLAPYLTYTFNKYHLQSIMNDQSPYFTNYKQRLYNYLQSMKIDHSYDLANFLFVAPYLNIFQYDCQGDVILNLVEKNSQLQIQ